jgi:hypothetical protein
MELPEEILEQCRRFLPGIMRGMLKGLFKLDNEHQDIVLKEMGIGCAQGIREVQIADGIKWPPAGSTDAEGAGKFLDTLVPHKRSFEKAGDTIHWYANVKDTYGGCVCPLVVLGIVEPRPELCRCSTNWCKANLEYLTGRSMEGELVESVNTGSRNCCYRFHLKPTLYSTASAKSSDADMKGGSGDGDTVQKKARRRNPPRAKKTTKKEN